MAKEIDESKQKALDMSPELPAGLAADCLPPSSVGVSMAGFAVSIEKEADRACQEYLPKISIDGEPEGKDRLGLSRTDRSMIEFGAEFMLEDSGVSKLRDSLVQDINAGDKIHDASVREKLGDYLEDHGPLAFERLVEQLQQVTAADYNWLNNISVAKDDEGHVTEINSNHFSVDLKKAELDRYIFFSPEDKVLADQAQKVKDEKFTEAGDLNAHEKVFLKSALVDLNQGVEYTSGALKQKFQDYLDEHGAEAFSQLVRKLQKGVGSDSTVKNNIHTEGDVNGNIVKVVGQGGIPLFDARERDPAYADERFLQTMHDDLHQGGIFKVEALKTGFQKYYDEHGPAAFAEFVHRLKKELAEDSESGNSISVSSDGNGNISTIVSDRHSDKPIVLFASPDKV